MNNDIKKENIISENEKTTMAARLMAFLNDVTVQEKYSLNYKVALEFLTRPEKGRQKCSLEDWEMLLRADQNLYLTAVNSVAKLNMKYAAAVAALHKKEQQEKRQEEREARRARRAEIDARIAFQNDPKAMKKHRLDQHRAALQARLDHLRNEIPRREAIIAEQPTLPAGLQDPYLPVILEQVKKEAAKIEAELAALGTE